MLRLEKVATPLEVVTLVAPDRVASPGLYPAGLLKMATVMTRVPFVITAPDTSISWTWTAGVIAAPTVTPSGAR
jgi:hypothetical protein